MLYFIVLPLITFTLYRSYNWIRNYREARSYGLPLILVPVSFQDTWWLPLRPLFSWVEQLPFGLGNWYIYTNVGWPTEDGARSLLKYGENFVLCSPRDNIIVSAEKQVVEQAIIARKPSPNGAEWEMSEAQLQVFAFYGQNVSSTSGEAWKRHRRVTINAFNERTMEHMWDEAVARTSALRLEERVAGLVSLGKLRDVMNVLAMQLLTVVGFGQETELTKVPRGHKMSLMDSLSFIMDNIMLTIIFNSLSAPDFVLPKLLQRLKLSVEEFRLYMQESVLQHLQTVRAKPEGRTGRPTTLLESIVRANEAGKEEGHKLWLSDSDLYGNIFVFNLAGYETTASTFTFALSYLAAHPDIQDWVAEEVDAHYGSAVGITDDKGDVDTPAYAHTYPKLVRCLAVMHETLRLAAHPPMFAKSPNIPTTVDLTPRGSTTPTTITVNPGTLVGFNIYGAHLAPSKWGTDYETFRPERFVQHERLVVPEDNDTLYLPWMAGPRVCPGKKFSQVEFVGVLAAILAKYRVEAAVLSESEMEEQARERLLGVLGDKYFNVSSHLKTPEDAALRFVRRG